MIAHVGSGRRGSTFSKRYTFSSHDGFNRERGGGGGNYHRLQSTRISVQTDVSVGAGLYPWIRGVSSVAGIGMSAGTPS